MTVVRVRLFAALRDAVGTAEVTVEAQRLSQLLEVLSARYGEPFTSRLARSSIVVDGDPVHAGDDRDLGEAREVVLLPPFSGG